MRPISAPISGAASTASTHPLAIAATGIALRAAVESCSAKQIPPSAFTSCTPSAPSEPSPPRTTAIALLPAVVAIDRKSVSSGRPRPSHRLKIPSWISSVARPAAT